MSIVTPKQKKEKMRMRIIRTAGELFEKKGFGKTSVGEIAKELGVGRTTIYDYFSDKNEMLALHFETVMEDYLVKALGLLAENRPLQEKLTAFAALQIEYSIYHQRLQQFFRAISKTSSGGTRKVIARLRERHTEIYRAMNDVIKAAVKEREIVDLPVELLVQLIINATAFPLKSAGDPAQTARQVISIFWTGISANRS